LSDYVKVLSSTPGISSFSPAVRVEYSLDRVVEVLSSLASLHKPRSVKVTVEGEPGVDRSALSRALTARLTASHGFYVDLEKPDVEYVVEVRGSDAYIAWEFFEGLGGLPYGIEGCLAVLASGGVDSAVATWLLVKRGVEPVLVYGDMGGFWSREAHARFAEFVKTLYEKIPWDSFRVYVVKGYGSFLASVSVPEKIRCLACKALLYYIASRIADIENCFGIATGEAIGQVASQTLSNLQATSSVVDKPIYRPLAAMDKTEIAELAEKYGFKKLARDVGTCTLKPLHPATHSTAKTREILRKLVAQYRSQLEALVERAVRIEYRGSELEPNLFE